MKANQQLPEEVWQQTLSHPPIRLQPASKFSQAWSTWTKNKIILASYSLYEKNVFFSLNLNNFSVSGHQNTFWHLGASQTNILIWNNWSIAMFLFFNTEWEWYYCPAGWQKIYINKKPSRRADIKEMFHKKRSLALKANTIIELCIKTVEGCGWVCRQRSIDLEWCRCEPSSRQFSRG